MINRRIDVLLAVGTVVLLMMMLVGGSEPFTGIFFIAVMLTVGIPHGALDHLIASKTGQWKKRGLSNFIMTYVLLMVGVAVVWYFFPQFAFILFLLISAYHFGQSQCFYIKGAEPLKYIIYTAWGALLLSAIILFNWQECMEIFASLPALQANNYLTRFNLTLIIVVSSSLWLIIHIQQMLNKQLSGKKVFTEALIIGLLLLTAYFTNAVFAFALYFGLWHSFRSLIMEYKVLQKDRNYSIIQFIKDLLPFSLVAILFLVIAYFGSGYLSLSISPYMLFIVLISMLTVPHLGVMSAVYENKELKSSYQ